MHMRKSLEPLRLQGFLVAEKEGFEPSRPFRGLHDFQSCALDQLGDFSILWDLAPTLYKGPLPASAGQAFLILTMCYYIKKDANVKPLFTFFSRCFHAL